MPPITSTLRGGEFHFCALNNFYNSTYYGSPTADSIIYLCVYNNEWTQSLNFVSNGVQYDAIHIIASTSTPSNRKMWYVANGVETLVHHNNLWALEAYKTITYETQNVREGISGLLDVTSSYCSGGFPAPAGTYKVLAPLASVGVLHAFVFSNFESHGDVFNSIDWSLGTTASPQATVRYTGPSVNDTYTHVTVYEEGWLDPRYQIITIPQGVYMSPNTEDFFSERLIPFQRNFIALSSNNKILKTNSGKIIIK